MIYLKYVVQVNVRIKNESGEGVYVNRDISSELQISGEKMISLDGLWSLIEIKFKKEYGERFDRIVNLRIARENEADVIMPRHPAKPEDLRPASKEAPIGASVKIGKLQKP